MNWNERPVKSSYVAYNLFSMIAATQQSLPQIEAEEHVKNLMGDEAAVRVYPDKAGFPRSLIANSPDSIVIGYAGAQTLAMFNGTVQGYLSGPMSDAEGNGNPFVYDAAYSTVTSLVALTKGAQLPVLIGGYSLGSCVAKSFLVLMKILYPTWPVTLHTFGGPKQGGSYQLSIFPHDAPNVVNWINDNDPVPLVFPSRVDSPEMHAPLSNSVSDRVNLYQSVGDFRELTFVGVINDNVPRPSQVSDNELGAIAGWMAGNQGWTTSGHHWSTYKQRLYFAKALYPDSAEPVPTSTQNMMDAVLANGPSVALDTPVIRPPVFSPNEQPVNLPGMPVGGGRVARRTASKKVEWNGVEVATMRTPSAARQLRNVLRRLRTAMRKSEDFVADAIDDAALLQLELDAAGVESTIR